MDIDIRCSLFKLSGFQARVAYVPHTTAQLSPLETGVLTKLVNSLEELSIVMGVHHNAE